jgi:ribosomal protein S18 acetylase RimI-like enzyme
MNSKLPEQLNVLPVSVENIHRIIKIGEQSNLSSWTFKDYEDEINRSDSIGLVYKNNRDNDLLPGTENIFGFLIARLIIVNIPVLDKVSNFNNFQNAAECEILNIAVDPFRRRNGIGQELFKALIEKCLSENVEFIWLEVRKNNEAAVKFYQKNGFEVVYTRKNYYQSPTDDALVMRAELCQNLST